MSFLNKFLPILLLTASLLVAKDEIPLKTLPTTKTVSAYGIVEPYGGEIGVATENTRIVDRVLVKEGDSVTKGQVLFIQEHDKEKAQLDILRAKVGVQEAELAISEDTLKRHRDLFEQEVVSDYQVTQSQLKVNANLSKLKVAQKELELGEQKLQAFAVQAPVDGKLYRFTVKEGQIVKANDLGNVRIGRPRLGIRCWVDQLHSSQLPIGTEVSIFHRTTDEFLGKGVVRHQALTLQSDHPLDGQAEKTDRFKMVLLELLDEDSTIANGTLVTVKAV